MMNRALQVATPPMDAARAEEIARSFDLRYLPDDFYANPHPVYAWLQAHEPVRRMPDGSYFLTRHADLVSVYRDARTFSSDKKVEFAAKYGDSTPLFAHHTGSLVFNDPPLHSRVRKRIMGALTRRAIADLEADLVRLVDRLLDRLVERGGGDLIDDFAAAIPVEVIGNLLAVPEAERAPLREWSLAILGALEPLPTAEQHVRGNRAVTEFAHYLKGLIGVRRRQPGDPEHDVLTRLIQDDAASGPPLTENELVQNCIFILNAGHETTSNLIGNALVALLNWPEAKRSLLLKMEQLTPGLIAQTPDLSIEVDEFLRFESSNQLGNRRALVAVEIAGTPIAAGSLITLCIGAANRDPRRFANPNELDLTRADNPHLAFGLGIHQCAGLSLARLEGAVAIGRFLKRFPSYALAGTPVRARRARFRGFESAPFTVR